MSDYTLINPETWKRALHCQIFRDSAEPCYCITLELDVSDFLKHSKEFGTSFSYGLMYAVTTTANTIEEFRYRFVNGQIALYDSIHTGFTYLDPETELFKVVEVPLASTLKDYVALATKTAQEQVPYFTGPLANNIYMFSPIPWIRYTHISHTISGKKDNATPLFDWGKYFTRDGRTLLPFSVSVHHSFVDGYHVGKFTNALQEVLLSTEIFM